jgi:hypothetical protein
MNEKKWIYIYWKNRLIKININKCFMVKKNIKLKDNLNKEEFFFNFLIYLLICNLLYLLYLNFENFDSIGDFNFFLVFFYFYFLGLIFSKIEI